MKPKFKKVVDAEDLVSTRLFLANEMMLDPRGKSFDKMRSYAEVAFSNLYETHDGAPFEFDRGKWNEDLLFSVKNDLDSNFSRGRLDYYCDLAKVVLREKAANLDAEEQRRFDDCANRQKSNCRTMSKKDVYKGIGIGGASLAIAGLFIEKTAIACAVSSLGVIGMAVGGYLLYNENKK